MCNDLRKCDSTLEAWWSWLVRVLFNLISLSGWFINKEKHRWQIHVSVVLVVTLNIMTSILYTRRSKFSSISHVFSYLFVLLYIAIRLAHNCLFRIRVSQDFVRLRICAGLGHCSEKKLRHFVWSTRRYICAGLFNEIAYNLPGE